MNVSWLRPVYESGRAGPYATVYLDATRSGEAGAREVELRWRAAEQQLTDAGAPETLLKGLADAATAPTGHPGAHGLALVAAEEQVVLSHVLPRPPARTGATWSAVPHLLPMVRQESLTVPYLLVLADRTGADLTVVGRHGNEVESREVESTDEVIHKVPSGGWSSARYQRRVEDSWEKNGAEVARALDKLVVAHGAQLVLVAGDVRATSALLEHVSERTREVVVELQPGSRAPGASSEAVQDEVDEMVAKTATAGLVDVLDRYEQEQGRGGAAVEGLPGVVEAVRRAQVDTLLLRDDPSATTSLWVGPETLQVALTHQELADLGVDDPKQDRADAVLLRALVESGADLVLVPPGGPAPADGIGALLRYSDASTG